MVATQSAPGRAGGRSRASHRPGRAMALALVLTFALSLVPAVPPAAAQVLPKVYIEGASTVMTQTNFHGGKMPTNFVDNSSSPVTLNITLRNTGAALTNVPVYAYFSGGGFGACTFLDLPAGSSATPSTNWTHFTLPTRQWEAGAHNLTLQAFMPVPPEVTTGDGCTIPSGGATIAIDSAPTATTCVTSTDDYNCRQDDSLTDNYARFFLVKEAFLDLRVKEIRWCISSPEGTTPCTQLLNGSPANVTPTSGGRMESYFEVEVENVGGWADMRDYSCNCTTSGFQYALNLSVSGLGIEDPWYSAGTDTMAFTVDDADRPTHRARSAPFFINNRAGAYNVTAWIDREGQLRRAGTDTSVDRAWMDPPFEIAYRDYTATFKESEFRTSPSNPYPFSGGGFIRGNVTLKNIGPASTPDDVTVTYRVFLDSPSSPVFRIPATGSDGTFTPRGNVRDGNNEQTIAIDWQYSDITTSNRYLAPGKHTLIVQMDRSGAGVVEGNETNNETRLDIYVLDASAPIFTGAPTITLAVPGGGGPAVTTVRPGEPFNVATVVNDDDANMTVMGNFSLKSDPSVYRVVKANKTATGNAYHFSQFNFSYHNFSARALDGSENWTLRVQANDSAQNWANSSAVDLKLIPWPIHSVPPSEVIVEPDWPNATTPYEEGSVLFTVRVLPNMTGFDGENGRPEQQTHTRNLGYVIKTPQGESVADGTYWGYEQDAAENCPPDGATPGRDLPVVEEETPTCTPQYEALNNTFSTLVPKKDLLTGPGRWNYSILVHDVSGLPALFNGSILVLDEPPRIRQAAINLSTVVPTTALTSVNITANFTDDGNLSVEPYVKFRRFEPNDSAELNFSIPLAFDGSNGSESFLRYYNHTLHMEVGRGKMFGLAGKFAASIDVKDRAGNWNTTSLGTFQVQDETPPRILDYGVTPSAAEIGENVTFWATANDETNVSMVLEVFRSSTIGEVLFDPVVINQSGTLNYTFTTNFTEEAIHAWRFKAFDGAQRESEVRSGLLTIRDNLGPRYDIRSPSTLIDGTRYGSGTPRIEIVLSDVEGVLASSIDLKVAGLPAEFELVPAPGNVTGFLLVHEVRAAKKFNHQDVVEINLTAQDNSTERLTSYLNFSFVVDDVAPTVRILGITPSYRDQPGNVLNVSLASRFTLAAEDVDSLPTGIPADGIRYRILGGGPSAAETIYTGPFSIDDAPGVYTGPRLYQIQFWAEDAVGNFNRNPNQTTVYVDDTPPALFQFFPQGRNVNATFVDDRVGVNRSVVWYRLNDQPYVPITLNEVEGAWTVTLPEGVKGDRISYYLQAWDRLDNTELFGNATNPYASFDVSNQEPRVRITAPVEGSRVSRSVDLTWDATDADGDALVYTVFVKGPGKQTFAELVKIENTAVKRYTIDTTRYPDGQYTFRVAAGDGGFVKLAETTITILNRVDAVGLVSVVGDALPGETLLIKAEVTKAEAIVEARLYLGKDLVDSYAMNDEGRDGDERSADGIYSVRVPVDAAGDYRVEIFTRYREDGQLKESTVASAATFSAKMTPGYILAEYGALIALIGLLAAVGIGVAVFVAMRKR